MTKYTPQVKEAFKGIQPPYSNFVLDVVEYKSYLGLRVYTNNIDNFTQGQKVSIAEYLYKVRDTIRGLGVKCQFERVDGDPPRVG